MAIAALLENRTELAPMSRPMTQKELAEFQGKFGYAPTRITVGLDAIAVYVNKYNPLEAMSLKQLDGVFSASHKRGGESIKTWGQLGLGGDWADLDIAPKGPAKTHGMYGVFKYVYVNKKPGASLSPLAGHLLGFVCSKQGQETSAKEGNYPLNAEVSAKECFGNR